MKIAVIGAGTSGLAVALFLKKSGHDVTIYEKFESPRALGSGLLLQPTGLAVLAKLGLAEQAIARSSRIDGIKGYVAQSGRTIFDVSYKTLGPDLFGLGIHRHTLFSILHDEVVRTGVPTVTSVSVDDVQYDEHKKPIILGSGSRYGPFDLVIVAQGAKASLRHLFVTTKKDKPYPYAAVWGVCKDRDGDFKNGLFQRYLKASHMIGVMPIGTLGDDDCESVAFFWSLRGSDYAVWREQDFSTWQNYVISLWPGAASLVHQFQSATDLNFAEYRDVVLETCFAHRVVFIGDAAHATSPQLGQGANLGLMDAKVLNDCLSETVDVGAALRSYARKRKRQVHFYQTASHWLTPFFQSDSRVLPLIRDLLFGIMCRLPFVKTEMVRTLAGVKTGLFTALNPHDIFTDATPEKINEPLYQQILGAMWFDLPASVQHMHDVRALKTVEGFARVERGVGLMSRLIARIVGFPRASNNVPLQVSFETESGREIWRRTFGSDSFQSVQSLAGGRSRDLISERFGILTFGLKPVLESGRLYLIVSRMWILGLPLPRFIWPKGDTFEYEKDGTFHFHVEITLPFIGLIVRYRGWLR